jgi:potassium efflux system protein
VLLIIIIAMAAGKNLPALLEILLLQHTSVSAGSRYTIITLTGYTITAIGAVRLQHPRPDLGAGAMAGGGAQRRHRLRPAGDRRQLHQRPDHPVRAPVRVGDIVTIGDTTGVVTKIEIRATTIRNWDRKELLVPNKEFITGRLLNWTLTDQINRIVITVGASSTAAIPARPATAGEVAAENERVLDDPAPLINFEGFGDNALRLVLRCYLDHGISLAPSRVAPGHRRQVPRRRHRHRLPAARHPSARIGATTPIPPTTRSRTA